MAIQDDYLMRLYHIVHACWPDEAPPPKLRSEPTGENVRPRPAILGPCSLPEYPSRHCWGQQVPVEPSNDLAEPERPVLTPTVARKVWGQLNIEFYEAMLKGAESALAKFGVSLGTKSDLQQRGCVVLEDRFELSNLENDVVAKGIYAARCQFLYPKRDSEAIASMVENDPGGYAERLWQQIFQALSAQGIHLGVTNPELREEHGNDHIFHIFRAITAEDIDLYTRDFDVEIMSGPLSDEQIADMADKLLGKRLPDGV